MTAVANKGREKDTNKAANTPSAPSSAMDVERLALTDFRSWHQLLVDFSPGVNVLVGRNGIGKTNIVEALEFLSVGSSHRASASRWLVRRGTAHAVIRANACIGKTADEDDNRQVRLQVTIPQRGAVRTRLGNGSSGYFGDIAGLVKVVLFSPADEQLVSGAPALRRQFLNQTCTLMDPSFYRTLQRFRQTARQRAVVLKRLQEGFDSDEGRHSALAELEAWTAQFTALGIEITTARAQAVKELAPLVTAIYEDLSGEKDAAHLIYRPSFAEMANKQADPAEVRLTIARHFQRLYAGEVARGASLIGPQRDDLDMLLAGEPARQTASNGEMWTIALALRMAQYRWLAVRGPKPILVLDDVFSQLDEQRRTQILAFAKGCGQVFITVAARGDVPDELGQASPSSSNLTAADQATRSEAATPGTSTAVRVIDVEKLAEPKKTDPLEDMAADLHQKRDLSRKTDLTTTAGLPKKAGK